MRFVTGLVDTVCHSLHIPSPIHGGVRRAAVAATCAAIAAGVSYVAAHAVDLHLSPYQVGVLGFVVQGADKARRATSNP